MVAAVMKTHFLLKTSDSGGADTGLSIEMVASTSAIVGEDCVEESVMALGFLEAD